MGSSPAPSSSRLASGSSKALLRPGFGRIVRFGIRKARLKAVLRQRIRASRLRASDSGLVHPSRT
jgi:hypothetical protein